MAKVELQVDSRYDPRFIAKLARLLKEEQPTILHTHLPRADLAGAFGHHLHPAMAWVCSVHGIYSECWSGQWIIPLFRSVWRRANGVIAISSAVRDWLVRERGVLPAKVTVIQYGIEPERFAQSNADFRTLWDLNGRAVIGSLGRLEPGKGYDCLIRAMPALLEQVSNAALVIAGHDPWSYGQTLQALIARLGLNGHVHLVGFQADVASFLAALDVFAFASRSEGFGQVLIEAMAAGKPVVVSKIPPLTEIVADGETGLLVEPNRPEAFARTITWLLSHPEKAKQMARQGRERVRTYYSIERETVETVALYKKVIAQCVASAAG